MFQPARALTATAAVALRDYQRLAVDYIHVALGDDPIYVALPTGTGKAVAAAAIAANVQARGRVLVIAHRKELIGQLAGHMRQWCGSGRVGVVMAERDECDKPVIVGSIQTLSEKSRLNSVLAAGPFALVVIDECHHAALNNTYGALVDRIPGASVLGFSATPRTRRTSKFDPMFKICVFERTIGQMSDAGILAPLRQQRVEIPWDLTGAPTRQQADSDELDYAPHWIDANAREPEVLDALVRGTIEHIGHRKTLAFCTSVEHAIELALAFDKAGVSAAPIWGAMPARDRAMVLEAWRNGEIQLVTNFGVLTEGFDFPEIACIIMARPTRSTTLYLQMLGRGTRTAPGKIDCLILDTTGLAPDHRQIQLGSIIPLDDDGAPPPLDGKRERYLTLLDPRSAGRWKWIVIPKTNASETDVFIATVDHKRHLLVIGDVRSGLWRIYVEQTNGNFVPLSGAKCPQHEAVARAAEWLRHHSVLPLSKKNAGWHDKPPSDKQLAFVQTLYPRAELDLLMKGRNPTREFVSSLIDQKMAARKAHKLRRQLQPELLEQSPAYKALQQWPSLQQRWLQEQRQAAEGMAL